MRLYELEQCWLRSQFSELLQCEHAVQLVQLEPIAIMRVSILFGRARGAIHIQLSQSLQPTQLLQFRLPPWPVWYVLGHAISPVVSFPAMCVLTRTLASPQLWSSPDP